MTTILVIDDDVFAATVVRVAVPDWTVEVKLDGLLALDYLRQASAIHELPDLILLDISMPGINGYETCVAIRFMNITVPIVPYTITKDVRADYLRNLGCTSVVYKGISADELEAHLRTTLTSFTPVEIPMATLMELYRNVLAVEEDARRARVNMRVGLLASSIVERMGLKTLLDGSGAQVLATSDSDVELRSQLMSARCTALVAAARDRRTALDLASALELPLLFLVDNAGLGQELQWQLGPQREGATPIGIVAVPSLTRVPLASVLQQLVEQHGYLDPAVQTGSITTPEQQALRARFRDDFGVELATRQVMFLLLEARGFEMRAIAEHLEMTQQAAYQLRQRLAAAVKHPPRQLRRITLETLAAHRSEQL